MRVGKFFLFCCSLASGFCAAFCLLTLTLPNRFDTTIGFGNAGVEIIRQNLLKDSTTIGNLALDQSGSIVNCIFLFCDIRQFTDATEALQEEVFVFTNNIALVVHSICNTFAILECQIARLGQPMMILPCLSIWRQRS